MARYIISSFAVFLAFLLVFSAGCTTAPSPAQSSTPVPAAPTTQATVDDANLAETIAWLDTAAEQQRRDWNIPGMAVAVVKDGKVVFAKAYGTKRYGGTDPVTTESVFEIGSTSKAFTSTLVAQEVDKGHMNWTDPVIWYIPTFEMKDPNVTREYSITDSMAQRSGIPNNWGLDVVIMGYNRSEAIDALRAAEPEGTFRTDYMYQNIPWLAAAAAVENTSRMSWEENLQTGIFTPLNLTSGSTSFRALAAAPDHVTLHEMVRLPNGTIVPHPIDENWAFNSWSDTVGPAGGMNLNIRDFATWATFQLGNGSWNGKQLVSKESMEYMHSPKVRVADSSELVPGARESYDQGWVSEEFPHSPTMIWHNGNAIGGHAMIMLVPEENLGVVVLENEAGPTAGDGLAFQFYNKYFLGKEDPALFANLKKSMEGGYAYLYNPPAVIKPANPALPLPLSKYTGTYASDEYGPATVATKDGNLTLTVGKTLGTTPIVFVLTPWDGNTFSSTCPAWGSDYNGWVSFGTGADGSVKDLTTSLFLETNLYHRNATYARTGSA